MRDGGGQPVTPSGLRAGSNRQRLPGGYLMHPAPPAKDIPPADGLLVNAIRFHEWYVANDSSVRSVRRGLRSTLDAIGVHPDTADTAVLIASELAANAVRHASHGNPSQTFCVEIRIRASNPTVLRIGVFDRSTNAPALPPKPVLDIPDDAVSGRGLPMVADMCHQRIGCAIHPGTGKMMWCELDIDSDNRVPVSV